MIVKSYHLSVHAAATLDWCMRFNLQPPIDLQTLLCGLQREDIWGEAYSMLKAARKKSRENFIYGESKLHSTHFDIMTSYNNKLTGYINMIEEKSDLDFNKSEKNKDNRVVLDNIYNIIYNSIFESENLLYGNKE